MMADWHPMRSAIPYEWVIRGGRDMEPIGVIRRFDFGRSTHRDTWYRAVTWSDSSEHRILIGWTRTPERAAEIIAELYGIRDSVRHKAAARRASIVDAAQMIDAATVAYIDSLKRV